MFSDDLDVFEFINSKDIKAHLKNLNYKFNTLEAAWLVYQCKHISIDEKHSAFEKIIKSMPDCEVPERMNTVYKASLHQYLKEYIATENRLLNSFFKNYKNCFFEYSFFDKRDRGMRSDKCYYDFKECLKDAIKETREFGVKNFEIRKRKINTEYCAELIFINEKVYGYGIAYEEEDEYELLHNVFCGLYFNFPTPFKEGDILCEYKFGDKRVGFCRGPFVICCLPTKRIFNDTLDTSDMNVGGYFLDDSNSFYLATMHNYMNLEFYRGDLKGKNKLFEILSMYTKGQLDISLFASAYHHVLCEENLKESLSKMCCNDIVSHLINGEYEQNQE